MKIYDFKNIEKIYLNGDIHGEWGEFFYHITSNLRQKSKEISNTNDIPLKPWDFDDKNDLTPHSFKDSIIIVLGDCGIGFESPNFYKLLFEKQNKILAEYNTHVLLIRGNHDNPIYFNNELINYSNIKTLPDYSVLLTKFGDMLCVGGGVSVDRMWRKQQEARINKYKKPNSKHRKELYWKDEMPFFDEMYLNGLKDKDINITTVLSHTAPSVAEPKTKDGIVNWLMYDKELSKDIDIERQTMDDILNTLQNNGHDLSIWCYGHFHDDFFNKVDNVFFIGFNHEINLTPYDSLIKSPLYKNFFQEKNEGAIEPF